MSKKWLRLIWWDNPDWLSKNMLSVVLNRTCSQKEKVMLLKVRCLKDTCWFDSKMHFMLKDLEAVLYHYFIIFVQQTSKSGSKRPCVWCYIDMLNNCYYVVKFGHHFKNASSDCCQLGEALSHLSRQQFSPNNVWHVLVGDCKFQSTFNVSNFWVRPYFLHWPCWCQTDFYDNSDTPLWFLDCFGSF